MASTKELLREKILARMPGAGPRCLDSSGEHGEVREHVQHALQPHSDIEPQLDAAMGMDIEQPDPAPVRAVARPSKKPWGIRKNSKAMHQLSRANKSKRKRTIKQVFGDVGSVLYRDIKNFKVQLEMEGGESLSFTVGDDQQDVGEEEEMEHSTHLLNVIAIKDKFRISDEALHEIHMLNKPIPPKNQIQEEKQRLNGVIPIKEADGVSILTRYLYKKGLSVV